MKEIILYKSPWKALRLLLLSSFFVFPSIWFIASGNTKAVFWVALCFFGLAFLIGIFHLLDRRPQIIINKDGVWDRSTKQGLVRWEYIERAYVIGIGNERFIPLVTKNSFVPRHTLYPWASLINRKVKGRDVNLSVGQIKVNIRELVDLLNALAAAPVESRENLIERYNHELKGYRHPLKNS